MYIIPLSSAHPQALWLMLYLILTKSMDPPYFFFFFFFVFFLYRVTLVALGSSQARGLNWSCCHWPAPEPQQHQIRAASENYTIVHANTGSLTHWARPGIEPATSWFLVWFISNAPWRELPYFFIDGKTEALEAWATHLRPTLWVSGQKGL